MQTGFMIALLQALIPKRVEQLSSAGGVNDAGKILVVGQDGKVKTETLTSDSALVDSELSTTSTKPIQNKAVAEYVDLSSAQISTLTGLLE